MESRIIKVNPELRPEFPFFARDNSNQHYLWFVTGKSERKGIVKAFLAGGHNNYLPFEYQTEIRLTNVTKIKRMRLTYLIGSNVG